jgi:hypothetical protein
MKNDSVNDTCLDLHVWSDHCYASDIAKIVLKMDNLALKRRSGVWNGVRETKGFGYIKWFAR